MGLNGVSQLQSRGRSVYNQSNGVCVCVFSSHPFWTSSSLGVPAGVTHGVYYSIDSPCTSVRAFACSSRETLTILSVANVAINIRRI